MPVYEVTRKIVAYQTYMVEADNPKKATQYAGFKLAEGQNFTKARIANEGKARWKVTEVPAPATEDKAPE